MTSKFDLIGQPVPGSTSGVYDYCAKCEELIVVNRVDTHNYCKACGPYKKNNDYPERLNGLPMWLALTRYKEQTDAESHHDYIRSREEQ